MAVCSRFLPMTTASDVPAPAGAGNGKALCPAFESCSGVHHGGADGKRWCTILDIGRGRYLRWSVTTHSLPGVSRQDAKNAKRSGGFVRYHRFKWPDIKFTSQLPSIHGHMATGFLPYVQDERYVTGARMRRSDPANYRPSMDINPFLGVLGVLARSSLFGFMRH